MEEIDDGNCRNHERVSLVGDRTKVAVRSHNPNVDAGWAIVGRVEATSRKLSLPHPTRLMLRQELKFLLRKVLTLVQWVEDSAEFIYNAIATGRS